jgi:hypothetical protein
MARPYLQGRENTGKDTTQMEKSPSLFVGVDVSKDQLDVAFSTGTKPQRVRNDGRHLKRFIEELLS